MPGWWVRRWAPVPALASAVVGEPRQEEQLIKACQWPGRELTVRDSTMVVSVTAAGLLFSSLWQLEDLPCPYSGLMNSPERTQLLAQGSWANQSSTAHWTKELAQNWI